MSSRCSKIAAVAATFIAMTLTAAAEPPAGQADMPGGDVWITPDVPGAFPAQAAQNGPVYRQLPTGDFWPAEETITRAAETPAAARPKAAREDVAAGK